MFGKHTRQIIQAAQVTMPVSEEIDEHQFVERCEFPHLVVVPNLRVDRAVHDDAPFSLWARTLAKKKRRVDVPPGRKACHARFPGGISALFLARRGYFRRAKTLVFALEP